ncbi:MAG: hypothetical protein [Caudoviricetes sp.]|nr:MAG: hypothetical protein [Caudoviricetes sp.]
MLFELLPFAYGVLAFGVCIVAGGALVLWLEKK